VLWSPVRYISNGYNATPRDTDALTDLLWLPTEREMFGSRTRSFAVETEENQARLEYYTGDEYRKKFMIGNNLMWWRLSSPFSSNSLSFCVVNDDHPGNSMAINAGGVAPAFCVQ
jgi:hypothetical protein